MPAARHLAVLHVFGVRQDVLGREFLARNLDAERLFELEHDVEKVDRLGTQVADHRRLRA